MYNCGNFRISVSDINGEIVTKAYYQKETEPTTLLESYDDLLSFDFDHHFEQAIDAAKEYMKTKRNRQAKELSTKLKSMGLEAIGSSGYSFRIQNSLLLKLRSIEGLKLSEFINMAIAEKLEKDCQ